MKISVIRKAVENLMPKKKKNEKNKGTHRVALIKDTSLEFNKLWLNVFIVPEGPVEEALMIRLFTRSGCRASPTVEQADLVVFGGGVDVTPALYTDKGAHSSVHNHVKRDLADLEIYEKCLNLGIPMVGICRGAQFGHVMNGGTLYQHVDRHNGDHAMLCHMENRILPRISSSHHQMVEETNWMEIIGSISKQSTRRYTSPTLVQAYDKHTDIEAFWYPDTCFLGVQGHPEYRGYNQYAQWFLSVIDHLINTNPDLVSEKDEANKTTYNRLRKEVMDRRNTDRLLSVDKARQVLQWELDKTKEKV